MTDDATMKVADFFDGCIDDGLVDTTPPAVLPRVVRACASGRIAAVTSASWGDALIESIHGGKGKWKVAPMREVGRVRLRLERDRRLERAVLANAKHPKEALEFITWMTTSEEGINAMIQYCGIGWSPAKDYIGAQRQKPSAWFSGQNYNEDVFDPRRQGAERGLVVSPVTQSAFTSLQNQFPPQDHRQPQALRRRRTRPGRDRASRSRKRGLSVRTAR